LCGGIYVFSGELYLQNLRRSTFFLLHLCTNKITQHLTSELCHHTVRYVSSLFLNFGSIRIYSFDCDCFLRFHRGICHEVKSNVFLQVSKTNRKSRTREQQKKEKAEEEGSQKCQDTKELFILVCL